MDESSCCYRHGTCTCIYVVQWAVIGFLSPALVSITDIYANIAIALCVLVVSYFGGILLK